MDIKHSIDLTGKNKEIIFLKRLANHYRKLYNSVYDTMIRREDINFIVNKIIEFEHPQNIIDKKLYLGMRTHANEVGDFLEDYVDTKKYVYTIGNVYVVEGYFYFNDRIFFVPELELKQRKLKTYRVSFIKFELENNILTFTIHPDDAAIYYSCNKENITNTSNFLVDEKYMTLTYHNLQKRYAGGYKDFVIRMLSTK